MKIRTTTNDFFVFVCLFERLKTLAERILLSPGMNAARERVTLPEAIHLQLSYNNCVADGSNVEVTTIGSCESSNEKLICFYLASTRYRVKAPLL